MFDIIKKLVKWENTNDKGVLQAAHAEILKSTDNNPPPVYDPFCGGGSIPLEAQRLGLEAHASDLNPVAVLITKALIEIPPKFKDLPPVNPESRQDLLPIVTWKGASGLAEDIRYYGRWMRDEAKKRIGHLYPKVKLPKQYGSGEATVIAWLWARTVKSPNPAFSHVDVPLVTTFILSSKPGREAWIDPIVEGDAYRFEVRQGKPPESAKSGTKLGRGASFRCLLSNTPIDKKYIREEFQAKRAGERLMAIVAEGKGGRIYLPPNSEGD